MHLLFINRFFYPDQSATARLLTDVAEEFASKGWSITVITGRMAYLDARLIGPPEEVHKGVIVRRVWSTRYGRRSAIGRLADYLTFYLSAAWETVRMKNVDCLLVLSDPPMLSFVAALLGPLKRWKTICWLQDMFPENAVSAGLLADGWIARILTRTARWSHQAADHVIVVGRCMERRLLSAGLPQERITWISNWADGESLAPLSSDENWFRKDQGLDGRFVVMYSGNLGVVHDADSLLRVIRAMKDVAEICFVFMIYGQGKGYLEEHGQRERLRNLRFIDYQTHQHLRYSLSAGDLHLVSLRADMEGFSVPSKVYGIMAVGRPVLFIGPKESEAAMIVNEAGCGLVFPPLESEQAAPAIRHLAGDAKRREQLGAAGRRYFEATLDKQKAMERFRTFFLEVNRE